MSKLILKVLLALFFVGAGINHFLRTMALHPDTVTAIGLAWSPRTDR